MRDPNLFSRGINRKTIKKDDRHDGRKGKSPVKPIIAGVLAIALLAGMYFGYRFLFPGTKSIAFHAAFPGSRSADLTYESKKTAVDLKEGFQNKLIQTIGVLEYYQIAGKTGTPPAVKSTKMLFEDQIELLSFYIEQKNRSAFNKLNSWIKSTFQADNGLFVKQVDSGSFNKPGGALEIRVSDQIRYCRVLIEAYDRFGQGGDLDLVRALSTQLYPLCKANNLLPPELSIALPEETPTPDFTATPEPKPSAVPTIDASKITYIGVVDLASIDLYALRLLSFVESGWEDVYRNCLDVIQKAAIDSPVPFYQAGYNIRESGYVPYLTGNAEFIFEDQMKIMLHLAEVSQTRESSFSYLKQLLLNTSTFYETYEILTAKASSERESIAGYAYMARIARIRQDKELYDLCIGRIEWNTATSASSDIYGLPFRTSAEGSILAYAKDAIGALKAEY